MLTQNVLRDGHAPDLPVAGDPGLDTAGVPLEVDGVACVFGDETGLRPTTLALRPGEFVSVLGPSGCGKSTLLRCLAGLQTPQSGTIRFGERTVFEADSGVDLAPRARRIGMVFQDLALWPHLSAFENVAFPLRVAKPAIDRGRVEHRVTEALETVGLGSHAVKLPHQLSGGQQQRVAVARAIVARPDVLLMDEPFSALDAALKIQLREELKSLTHAIGVTTVFVTHDQEEAMGLSDRIAVLFDGRVQQFSSPQHLYERPATEMVAGFIGAFNSLPDRRGGVRPEAVTLATADGEPDPAADLTYAGVVRACDYRGGFFRIAASIPGVEKPWIVDARRACAPGSRVHLGVRAADVIGFDGADPAP